MLIVMILADMAFAWRSRADVVALTLTESLFARPTRRVPLCVGTSPSSWLPWGHTTALTGSVTGGAEASAGSVAGLKFGDH